MAAPTTSLTAVHEAIIDALRARFGARIARYGAYEDWDDLTGEGEPDLVTPALLLELEAEEYDCQSDPSGRLAVRCTWAVHCVLSVATDQLQLTLRQLGSAVASVVLPRGVPRRRGNRWGLEAAVEFPERVTGQAGGFSPGLNGRDARLIRWEQIVYLDEESPL